MNFEREWDARRVGGVLCLLALALLSFPSPLSSPALPAFVTSHLSLLPLELMEVALALELLALAFWSWARASADAERQIRRWTWLRRPAQAMWLAAAAQLVSGQLAPGSLSAAWLPRLAAGAMVWAGLDLMAALPLARPYSDLSGPLLAMRPWLPALLPAAGFVVLWRTAPEWTAVEGVRRTALLLLLITAVLATLRAFGRRQWATALRWLIVSESAMAGALVATRELPPAAALLLWVGSCGGRAFMLAGELRGATPRRGAALSRLWRAGGWAGSAALAWPLVVALTRERPLALASIGLAAAGVAGALTAYVSVRRVVRAPERRRLVRAEAPLTLSHVSAVLTLVIGPLTLAGAFVAGVRVDPLAAAVGLAPAILGAALAGMSTRNRGPIVVGFETAGSRARRLARRAFRSVTALEQSSLRALARALRASLAPLWELHTGDAQEYLLFVVGLSVLALVLPFLR